MLLQVHGSQHNRETRGAYRALKSYSVGRRACCQCTGVNLREPITLEKRAIDSTEIAARGQ